MLAHYFSSIYILQETEYKICIYIIFKNLYKKLIKADEKLRYKLLQKIISEGIRIMFITFILDALKRQRADGNDKRNLGLKFAEPSLVTSRATSPF